MVPDLKARRIGGLGRKLITLSTYASYLTSRMLPRKVPVVFVSGFPKSGTVWVTQMVADYLQYPFVDLSLMPVGCPAVMHGHFLARRKGPRMVYVVRDGRDAMISMYYYMVREIPDGDHPKLPAGFRRYFAGLVNKNDIHEFLPTFIERQFRRPYGCRSNWVKHVDSYLSCDREDIPLVKYEDLLASPMETMKQALRTLNGNEEPDEELLSFAVRKFSFEKQTGRRAGEEDPKSFVRKGQAGDWKNFFSRQSAELFDQLAGSTLIKLGYEKDRSWIEEL
jgi:hypothetical protein